MQDSDYILFQKYISDQYDEYELSKYLRLTKNNISNELLVFIKIIENFNGGTLTYPIKTTSSSGTIVAFIFDNYVIKLFMSESTFNKETEIIENSVGNNNIVDSLGYISIVNGMIIRSDRIKINQEMIDKTTSLFVSITRKLQLTTNIHNNRMYLSVNLNNIKNIIILSINLSPFLDNFINFRNSLLFSSKSLPT